MKMLERKDWDLWFIIFGSLLLIGVDYLRSDSVVPIILGLPFLLFFPGYAAVVVISPARNGLDTAARVALSFGLSIAITPLVGIGLNVAHVGIRLTTILMVISVITIVMAVFALIVRKRTVDAYSPIAPMIAWKKAVFLASQGGRMHKLFSIILVIGILVSALALMYMVANPPQRQNFTEFYILGANGNSSNYPQELAVGQAASVYLGIVNHEHRQVNYTVEVWLCKASITTNLTDVSTMYYFNTINVSLPSVSDNLQGSWVKQWETIYKFQVNLPGEYRLFFLLYLDQEPALPESPMIPYHNYASTQAFRIMDTVNSNVSSLNLEMVVT
jgi:uncharacterized membrane protein